MNDLDALQAAQRNLTRVAAQYYSLRNCYIRVRPIAPQSATVLLEDCIGISYSYEAAILTYRAMAHAIGADAAAVALATTHLDDLYRTRAALLRTVAAMPLSSTPST